ncbi:MAG: uroporphyrinogen decarboxylase family protein [Ignavibacteriaceae bacterium]|nr:uroporphyrinogen decarboxylase family protein [Ignavibacteriaceae bacterium]
MTPRERIFKTLIKKQKPDRVPFEISWGAFTPRLMKTYYEKTGSALIPDEYFDFDTRFVIPGGTKLKLDYTQYFDVPVEQNVTFDEWGIGAIPTRYEIPDYKYHPLALSDNEKQIEEYNWPDLDAAYRYTSVEQKVKSYHDRGYAVNGEMYQTIFETAWLMRGFEQLMMDFYTNEEVAHTICESLTQIRINQVCQFAKTGVDIIRFGDDIVSQQGQLMDKDIYNKFIKLRMKRIIKAAKDINPDIIIFMHSCGKVENVIDDFIDIGVEILNPIQPECNNQQSIYNKYHDKLSFWGGIGVQSILPYGTPKEIRAKVKETSNVLGPNGGLLLAPAHILDPTIPWENILAFIDAARNNFY